MSDYQINANPNAAFGATNIPELYHIEDLQDVTLAAGEVRDIKEPFDYLTVLEASDGAAIRFIMYGGRENRLTPGIIYRPGITAPRAQIKNVSGAPITCRIAYGLGDIDDNRQQQSGAVTVNAGTTMATPDQVTVGTTAVLISAQDTTRNEIVLQNMSTSAQRITVGDVNVVSLTRGIVLDPGSSATVSGATLGLSTGAAIYAIADAVGAKLNVMELKD